MQIEILTTQKFSFYRVAFQQKSKFFYDSRNRDSKKITFLINLWVARK